MSRRNKRSHHRAENAVRAINDNFKENIIDINNYRKTKQKVTLLPKNIAQETYIDALQDDLIDIVFATGPAGCGKTYIATLCAIDGLKSGKYKKLIISRPNVAVDDKDIGYLPGDIFQKMAPWTRPIFDVLEEYYSVKDIKYMLEENIIELVPIAHLRGRTFKNSIVILDEAQNTTKNSMLSALTRIGEGSKIIVTGDLNQNDRGYNNGLSDFLNRFKSSGRIEVCRFDNRSIERHPVIDEILKMYDSE